jgi:hypothetical protein
MPLLYGWLMAEKGKLYGTRTPKGNEYREGANGNVGERCIIFPIKVDE